MKTIVLNSRETTEISLQELMEDGTISVFPHVEERGFLFLNFRKSKVALSAGPYIGLIPLSPNVIVDVRPKEPVSNVAHVLDMARSKVDYLSSYNRFYSSEMSKSASAFEFLVRNYLDSLSPIFSSGFLKEYVPMKENSSRSRGKISVQGTLVECHSRGHPLWLQTVRHEQTTNVPVNRVIKSALEFILTRKTIGTELSSSLIKNLNSSHGLIPREVKRLRPSDLVAASAAVQGRKLARGRDYYLRALDIATLILSERSVSFDQFGEDIELGTFVVNFETLFEDYLRNSLRLNCNKEMHVLDGNSSGKKPLFDDKDSPPAQPDIVLRKKVGDTCLVVEVKYKEKPNRNDINQAITYANSYKTKNAILLHQRSATGQRGIRLLGTINSVKLFAYAFDLSSSDLVAEEKTMARAFEEMLLQPPVNVAPGEAELTTT